MAIGLDCLESPCDTLMVRCSPAFYDDEETVTGADKASMRRLGKAHSPESTMNAEDNTAKEKEALAKLLGSDDEALVRQGFELLASLEKPTLVQAVVDESLLTPYLKTLFPEVIDPWEAMGPPEELTAEAWGDERLGRLLKSDNLSTDNEQGAGNWRELALLQMDCFFVVVIREGVLEYRMQTSRVAIVLVYLSKEDAEASYQSWFDDCSR